MALGPLARSTGGPGMFALGIHHLPEGLKSPAGDGLRRALHRLACGRISGLPCGPLITAVVPSSRDAMLSVIGFVRAGLTTFPKTPALMLGANLGTMVTSWLVAATGFKIKIAAFAMPILGVGAFFGHSRATVGARWARSCQGSACSSSASRQCNQAWYPAVGGPTAVPLPDQGQPACPHRLAASRPRSCNVPAPRPPQPERRLSGVLYHAWHPADSMRLAMIRFSHHGIDTHTIRTEPHR